MLCLGLFVTVAVKCTLVIANMPNLPIPINSRMEPANSFLQVYEYNEEE